MNSNPCLPRAPDSNIPKVNVPEVANRFSAELKCVCCALKITIPDKNVFAVDLATERVVALQRQAVVPTPGKIAIVQLNVAATDQVYCVSRFFDRDIGDRDVFAIVEQINKVTAGFVNHVIEEQISPRPDRDHLVTDVASLRVVALNHRAA